jgi:catechol 2,3-dioxygenase-like lactoylglutathione lyase family enzyme
MRSVITQLSHVCFTTADLDATRAFYCDVLGFKPIHEFRNDIGEVYGFYLAVGRATFIEFFKGPEPVDKESQFRHVCFVVENIEHVAEELQAGGISCAITRGRTDRTLQMWVTDPNGIKIEFHQYDQQSTLSEFQQ